MPETARKNQNTRVVAIDFIRLFAILAVLAIHTTSRALESTGQQLSQDVFGFFINQIGRFAVPLFFLVSGYVLQASYKRSGNLVVFYGKRIKRLIVPFILWSLFYIIFVYPENRPDLYHLLFEGRASYQLYFVPSLCLLYLLFPVISHLNFLTTRKGIIPLFIAWMVLLTLKYHRTLDDLSEPLLVALYNVFIFTAGVAAAKHAKTFNQIIDKTKAILPLLTLGLGLIVYFEGKTWFERTGNYLYYYSQWRPSIVLYSLSVFAASFAIFRKVKSAALISRLSELSLFVFFIHVAYLEWFWDLWFAARFSQPVPVGFDLLFFATVTGTSFGTAYLIHKIPNASRLTG